MALLDSYREKGFFGLRLFELFEDRIVVTRPYVLLRTTKVSVPLAQFEEGVEFQRFEEKTRNVGLIMFFLCACGALSWEKYPPIYTHPGFWSSCLFSFIGLLLVIRSFFQFEAAVFVTTRGSHRLIIASMGPDVLHFRDFTDRVLAQIKHCHEKDFETSSVGGQ